MRKNRRNLAVIVIGRNEGHRLLECLDSVAEYAENTVYVDSGSTDSSVRNATGKCAHVVELSDEKPFTAARARNAGFSYVNQNWPGVAYIQFLDGDCHLSASWLEQGEKELATSSDIAIVCGQRRESKPSESIFNIFCDIEWDTKPGLVESCGGDFLVKVEAFKQVGGFNPELIAGEEPELCFRLLQRGWKVSCLPILMTYHDAKILKLSQWVKRTERSGYAFQRGYQLHKRLNQGFNQRAVWSIYLWAAIVPIAIVLTTSMLNNWFILLWLVYPVKIVQVGLKLDSYYRLKMKLAYSCSIFVGKFIQLIGAVSASWDLLTTRQRSIIEYKNTDI